MKNNKLLNGGIIKEGIRQTRAVGIAYSSVSVLATMYCGLSYVDYAFDNRLKLQYSVSAYSGAMQFVAGLGIYILLPVLTIMMFSFLNSRSACDYYHSMPATRIQTVLSFTVAAAFWYFIPNIAVVLVETITGAVCGLPINWASLLMHILNLTALFLHVYGIMLLSMSLATGILNQIAAAGIIAFMPRILMYVLEAISENAAPVLIDFGTSLGTFGDIKFNLIFGSILYSGSEMFDNESIAPMLYSVALGIIYGGLGVVSYCRRKSEAATSAGANKYVQCGIRVLVSFLVCLIPCAEIGMILIKTHSPEELLTELSWMIPSLLFYYGIAVVAYFLYEAVTAKKIKGVITLKGTMGVGLLILLSLNLLFIIAPTLVANAALSAEINIDSVESVSLYEDSSYETEYYMLSVDKIRFDDEYIISTLCDSLDENIARIKKGNYSEYLYSSKMSSIEVTFNMSDGRRLNRCIYLQNNEYDRVYEKIINDEKYLNATRKIPTLNEVQTYYSNVNGLSEGQKKEFYEVLYSELSAMSSEEYSAYILNDTNIATIVVCGNKKGHSWRAEYPVNILAPVSYAKYVELCNATDDFDDKSFAEAFASCNDTFITVYLIEPNGKNDFETVWNVSFEGGDPTEDMLAATEKIQEYWKKPIDIEKPILMVDYYIETYVSATGSEYYVIRDEYSGLNGCHFISADDELIEFLKSHQPEEDMVN